MAVAGYEEGAKSGGGRSGGFVCNKCAAGCLLTTACASPEGKLPASRDPQLRTVSLMAQ